MKNKKLYVTGESYAGTYIPYISDHILSKVSKATNKKHGVNFQGMQINDPSWISDLLSEQLPAVEFAEHYQKVLQLNASTISNLQETARKFGVSNYVAKNLHYPPKGHLPLPKNFNASAFDPFDTMINAATNANPCFNIYNIDPIYKCPSVFDPLGYPPDKVDPSPTNFINNQTGFKEYIHADPKKTWLECVNNVFVGGDKSPAPADAGVIQRVIEKSPAQRSVIQVSFSQSYCRNLHSSFCSTVC